TPSRETSGRPRPSPHSGAANSAHADQGTDPAFNAERATQAGVLRCVLGDPFHPVALDPAWRTPSVLSLARAAYDARHLLSGHPPHARLLGGADALEEAGGTDAALLAHLRSAGPHCRGCHAVDAVLGLE